MFNFGVLAICSCKKKRKKKKESDEGLPLILICFQKGVPEKFSAECGDSRELWRRGTLRSAPVVGWLKGCNLSLSAGGRRDELSRRGLRYSLFLLNCVSFG